MAQRIRKLPVPKPKPKPKPRYRVTNWRDYNRALVARGAITLWIDEAVVAGWGAAGGKGWRYSDMAILCALGLRADAAPDPGLPARSDAAARAGDHRAALFHLLSARGHAHRPEARAPLRWSLAPRRRRHRAQGLRRGRVEGPRAWAGPAPGLAQAAPGGGHPNRRARRPRPDRERGPRRRRTRRACSPAPTRRSPRSAPTRPTTASTAMPPSSPATRSR